MPTCLSVNNVVCHNRPIGSDPEVILADGDVVKMFVSFSSFLVLGRGYVSSHEPTACSDLGVHLDGYIAPVASTIVVGAAEVTGPTADVIMAAYTAAEVALRMMRPGCKVCLPLYSPLVPS